MNAQIGTTSDGCTYLGNDSTFQSLDVLMLNTQGLFVKNYPGLFWERKDVSGVNPKLKNMFQLDMRPTAPCLAGNENIILFLNSITNNYQNIFVNSVFQDITPSSNSKLQEVINDPIDSAISKKISYVDLVDTFDLKENKMTISNTDNHLISKNIVPQIVGAIRNMQVKMIKQNVNLQELQEQENTSLELMSLAKLQKIEPVNYDKEISFAYDVPTSSNSSFVLISSMDGKPVKTISVKGSGNVLLEQGSLKPGIYDYTLLTDGIIVTTNRLIIVKR